MLEAAADLKPTDFEIDDKPDDEDFFIDNDKWFSEDGSLKEQDQKVIFVLTNITDFFDTDKIDYDKKPKMKIGKSKSQIKLDNILLALPPVKMEENKKKLNKMIRKGTKRKNSLKKIMLDDSDLSSHQKREKFEFVPKLNEDSIQVECIRKIPLLLRENLEQNIKNSELIEFVEKISLHSRKKLEHMYTYQNRRGGELDLIYPSIQLIDICVFLFYMYAKFWLNCKTKHLNYSVPNALSVVIVALTL